MANESVQTRDALRGRCQPMKVAFVAESMETGVGQLVCLYAAGLARRGHDIHVLHSRDRTSGEVIERLEALPTVKRQLVAMRRVVHSSDAAAVAAVRRYLIANGPFDIVHGHSSKGGLFARVAGIGLPGRRVYTPHAFYTLAPHLSPPARGFYGLAERVLARLCSAVVCSSEAELRHAEALGIDRTRLIVVYNGIEAPELGPPARPRFGFPADSVILGFVGRLDPQKAPDVLLNAIARALPAVPQLRAVMIGDGCLAESLRDLATRLGIADRVLWLGHRAVADYLASFDLLALSSRYEGFSLVPLEAMHAGLPIVCTAVGGVAEAVVDGDSGLIVGVDDVAAYAGAIVALARDPERRRAMGLVAQRRAQAFTAERMVASMEALYKSLVASGRAPAPTPPISSPARTVEPTIR
jgi:glycosyltransferase involved in cell wall biosynthesis